MKVKLYVEGGGDNKPLKSDCRKSFHTFFKKAGLRRQPRIVACGSRNNAYKDFCTAVKNAGHAELPMLLVDSEEQVEAKYVQNPWGHLYGRDKWSKPKGVGDEQVHLMVTCMEAWFMADKGELKKFFGNGFRESALPCHASIEAVDRHQLKRALKDAAKGTVKKTYGKGAHSFKILEQIDPQKVQNASPWTKRLIDTLKKNF